MRGTPTVSVGLPVRNGQNFLTEALDSILRQEFTDFELIISDNGSDDETEAICHRYLERDTRLQYHRFETNQGAARNYNLVFEKARGRYFKWATHDDICLPGMLRECVRVLDGAASSVVLVYPRAEIIDAEGRVSRVDSTCLHVRHRQAHKRLGHFLSNISLANPVFGLFRTEALRKTRLIDWFVGSDYVLLAELVLQGEIWEIPQILLQRRIHAGTSRRANATKRQALAWFDPHRAHRSAFLSIRARLVVEYLRSASRQQLPLAEKLLCLMIIPSFVYWTSFRDWGGLQKRKLKELISAKVAPTA